MTAKTQLESIVEMVGHCLYRSAGVLLLAVGRRAKRLKLGRLDAGLTHMLIALVAVPAVVTASA